MLKPKPVPVRPKKGEFIQGRYKVLRTLGEGGFGAVFEVVDKYSKNHYAMKPFQFELEKQPLDEPGLDLESAVLKRLQGYAHILEYIDEGEWGERAMAYLIMALAGPSLANLRHKSKDRHFSNNTSTRISIQCLTAIETVHLAGLLHRDIKPGNFAIGYSEQDARTVFILDFGLVRKHILSNGRVRPQRSSAAFRGSIQYASINAHKNIDLGRVDDLWCWLYMAVQLRVGKLPWRNFNGKKKAGEMKSKTPKAVLLLNMEDAYHTIYDNLKTLKYADEPSYDTYRDCLMKIMNKRNFTFEDPFDWEEDKEAIKSEKEQIKEVNMTTSKLSHIKSTEKGSEAIKTIDKDQKSKDEKTQISTVVVKKQSSDQIKTVPKPNVEKSVAKSLKNIVAKAAIQTLEGEANEEIILTAKDANLKVVQMAKAESSSKAVLKANEDGLSKVIQISADELKSKDVQKLKDKAQAKEKNGERSSEKSKSKPVNIKESQKPATDESKAKIDQKPKVEIEVSETRVKNAPPIKEETKIKVDAKPKVETKLKEEALAKAEQKSSDRAKGKEVRKVKDETKAKKAEESGDETSGEAKPKSVKAKEVEKSTVSESKAKVPEKSNIQTESGKTNGKVIQPIKEERKKQVNEKTKAEAKIKDEVCKQGSQMSNKDAKAKRMQKLKDAINSTDVKAEVSGPPNSDSKPKIIQTPKVRSKVNQISVKIDQPIKRQSKGKDERKPDAELKSKVVPTASKEQKSKDVEKEVRELTQKDAPEVVQSKPKEVQKSVQSKLKDIKKTSHQSKAKDKKKTSEPIQKDTRKVVQSKPKEVQKILRGLKPKDTKVIKDTKAKLIQKTIDLKAVSSKAKSRKTSRESKKSIQKSRKVSARKIVKKAVIGQKNVKFKNVKYVAEPKKNAVKEKRESNSASKND